MVREYPPREVSLLASTFSIFVVFIINVVLAVLIVLIFFFALLIPPGEHAQAGLINSALGIGK